MGGVSEVQGRLESEGGIVMTSVYRVLVPVVALASLAGCSSVPPSNVSDTTLAVASTEIPENQLLDVGIQTFSPGDVTKEQASEEGQMADIRSAESVYIPYHLKSTLQSTGQWGAVWVTPDDTDAVDLLVSGRIVSSSGEHLQDHNGSSGSGKRRPEFKIDIDLQRPQTHPLQIAA